ncbi:hypothetical protein J6590_026728 [Homalodisca vitripennis]|nr:hypothetical protein J6590_026728 [Homalodisca vitripennis]
MRQPCRAAAAVVWQRRAGQSILLVAANCTLWWFLEKYLSLTERFSVVRDLCSEDVGISSQPDTSAQCIALSTTPRISIRLQPAWTGLTG